MEKREKGESNLKKQHTKTKKKKILKYITISIIVFIAMCILYCVCYYYSLNRVKITYGKSTFSFNGYCIFVNGYLFDTGSYISKKKTKTLSSSYFLSAMPRDTHNTISLKNIYSEKEPLMLGTMIFENMCYEVLGNGHKDDQFEGIIGADIIKKANWEIDFGSKTIESFPLNYNYDSRNAIMSINFKHRFPTGLMNCSLTINGHKFKEKIDTGFSGLLSMTETDREKIGNDILYHSKENVHGDASIKQVDIYCYNKVNINSEECIHGLIEITPKHNILLGMQFFNEFNKIYIDNNKGIIYCF